MTRAGAPITVARVQRRANHPNYGHPSQAIAEFDIAHDGAAAVLSDVPGDVVQYDKSALCESDFRGTIEEVIGSAAR